MSQRNDPDVPYRYQIEIDGIQCVRFSECSALKSSTSIQSIREGGNNVYEHSMIQGNKFEDIVIKKGFYSAGSEFFLWMKQLHIKTKKIERKNISLIIMNDKFEETGRYNLYKAYPVEYEGPAFNAGSKDIAFEQVKIHYDFFEYHPGDALTGLIDASVNAASNALG
jgi:phage tail-like protein